MSNVSTKEMKIGNITQQQIEDIKNMTGFDEIQKNEQILIDLLPHLVKNVKNIKLMNNISWIKDSMICY